MTLGTFDGVHLGHKLIIERLVEAARDVNSESLVLTFFPHPRTVLRSGAEIRMLNTLSEKSLLLGQLGLENLVVHPFDEAFAALEAEEFVSQVLVDAFHTRKIIVGHDHRFGKGRTAGFEDLVRFGEKYGFEVEQIPAREIDEISVSSTKIRKALESGDIPLANAYLGYDYFFSGKVVHGNKLGRTIGFPTANLFLEDAAKLVPANGVYGVWCRIAEQEVMGMMNIGNRPTVDGTKLVTEVHFLDFEGDLYGQTLEIHLVGRVRDEVKFPSVEALKDQLSKDRESVRQMLGR